MTRRAALNTDRSFPRSFCVVAASFDRGFCHNPAANTVSCVAMRFVQLLVKNYPLPLWSEQKGVLMRPMTLQLVSSCQNKLPSELSLEIAPR